MKGTILFIKVVVFTVVAPGTVTVVVPYLILARHGQFSWPDWGLLPVIGLAPLCSGLAFYVRCAWDFAVRGRGTPAPIDPPKELVVRGLYRYSRNPMYLGILQILLGEMLLFRSAGMLIYAIAVAVAFNLFVRLYEEPALRRAFGPAYEAYCSRVPRWFGPPG